MCYTGRVIFLLSIIVLNSLSSVAQVKPAVSSIGPNDSTQYTFSGTLIDDYANEHNPNNDDIVVIRRYSRLIDQQPTKANYKHYYRLAASLWEAGRNDEAERMFRTIAASKEAFYTEERYHSSDIPGDATKTVYGYGSYASNYKHYAYKYLAKISLERKDYNTAEAYLDTASKEYPLEYTCGTGIMNYQEELRKLYGLCYLGSGKTDQNLDLLLPHCFESCGTLIKAIKNHYTHAEILDELRKAEGSIICTVDTEKTYESIVLPDGKGFRMEDLSSYTSGKGRVVLFGREVALPLPQLRNGETVDRNRFLATFQASDFYKGLAEADR